MTAETSPFASLGADFSPEGALTELSHRLRTGTYIMKRCSCAVRRSHLGCCTQRGLVLALVQACRNNTVSVEEVEDALEEFGLRMDFFVRSMEAGELGGAFSSPDVLAVSTKLTELARSEVAAGGKHAAVAACLAAVLAPGHDNLQRTGAKSTKRGTQRQLNAAKRIVLDAAQGWYVCPCGSFYLCTTRYLPHCSPCRRKLGAEKPSGRGVPAGTEPEPEHETQLAAYIKLLSNRMREAGGEAAPHDAPA